MGAIGNPDIIARRKGKKINGEAKVKCGESILVSTFLCLKEVLFLSI